MLFTGSNVLVKLASLFSMEETNSSMITSETYSDMSLFTIKVIIVLFQKELSLRLYYSSNYFTI